MKILFVVLVILGLMGVLAIGGVWFTWHKVKQAAANNGIDLNSFSETRRGPARQFDACELLTKEDLSQILNLNVERAEGDGRIQRVGAAHRQAAKLKASPRGSDKTG